jgi:hypothetical protein
MRAKEPQTGKNRCQLNDKTQATPADLATTVRFLLADFAGFANHLFLSITCVHSHEKMSKFWICAALPILVVLVVLGGGVHGAFMAHMFRCLSLFLT